MSNVTALAREEYPTRLMTRGEVVYRIVDAFDLDRTHESFLGACRLNLDDCFFVFSAMSDYDGIAFEPFLRLYPDVNDKYRYYEAITVASMLGLVHGYLHEDGTPFRPEVVMTRVQALKIVLGAADLLQWKEKFELSVEESQQTTLYADDAFSNPDNWWYHRYVNFASEKRIVVKDDLFRPDDPITFGELQEIMENALVYASEKRHGELNVATEAYAS